MKEIQNCINELKKLLKTREDELSLSESFNAYTQGKIENIRREIDFFESCFENIEKNPTCRTEILRNFKKEANRIKNKIKADLSGAPWHSDI